MLAKVIAEGKAEELKTLVNGWKLLADKNEFSLEDVINEFRAYMPPKAKKGGKKTNPANPGAAAKVHKDLDSAGERPQPGATYNMPDGTTWTYNGKGRTPDKAIAAVKGKTWASIQA